MTDTFSGFNRGALTFLRQLKKNNKREWFQPRKEIYEQQVKAPMLELVTAVMRTLADFAPDHVDDPNKAIFRIYRDTRFSKDKTPYKTHIAAAFPRRGGCKTSGYYFSVSAEEVEIGGGVYMHAKAQVAQWLLHDAWDKSRASGSPVKPWPWADTHPVARLLAPAQAADVLVLAGASGRTLAFGPGHLDGSALPGDAGNAVITAHRDTHFRFLRTIAPGDELVVERADGAMRHFRIRGAYVADYRDLQLPRDTAVPTVTLVTCYPFDALNPGGPLRYVVVAEAA